MKKVTAIICAYNEESTIKEVIKSLSKSSFFEEIIVVNDGSTDGTKAVIKEAKDLYEITDIHFEKNKGKGYAMAIGIENTRTDYILFIDADLSAITNDHLLQLTQPILDQKADMVMGQPTETIIRFELNPFKSFTGQRAVVREDILPIVEQMKEVRFGVETLINLHFTSNGKRIEYVKLENLIHPSKFDKTSSVNAVKEFVIEGKEIGLTAVKNYDLVYRSLKQVISKR